MAFRRRPPVMPSGAVFEITSVTAGVCPAGVTCRRRNTRERCVRGLAINCGRGPLIHTGQQCSKVAGAPTICSAHKIYKQMKSNYLAGQRHHSGRAGPRFVEDAPAVVAVCQGPVGVGIDGSDLGCEGVGRVCSSGEGAGRGGGWSVARRIGSKCLERVLLLSPVRAKGPSKLALQAGKSGEGGYVMQARGNWRRR